MKNTFIYALCDPSTGLTRYIGKANAPEVRLRRGHIPDARNGEKSHLYCWIRSLLNIGKLPKLEVLFSIPVADWQFWEKFMIDGFRKQGHDLVNLTPGGDGGIGGPNFKGRKHTSETRQKIRLALQGRPSPTRGVPHTAETRAKISASHTGKPHPYKKRFLTKPLILSTISNERD